MGKRSRKRGDALPADAAASRVPAPAAPRSRRRPGAEERPKPPWHPVPLVELCVLVGIVLLVLGFLAYETDRGKVMLVAGMALGALGGLDTALREHFTGFRSHSTLIAALPAVTTLAGAYFAGAPWLGIVLPAAAVFALAFWALRRAFRRRAGRARRARG